MIAPLLMLGLSCLTPKSQPLPENPSPVSHPTAEATIPMLTEYSQLQDHADQTIQIKGQVRNMKAGTAIELAGGRVWCTHQELSNLANQTILATGILKQGQSPMHSFPKASQNAEGEWTQGVGTPDPLSPTADILSPSPSEAISAPEQAEPTSQTAWLIEITDYEVVHP